MATNTPGAQLNAFLSQYSPEMQSLGKKLLAAMRKRVPGSVEMVYDNYNALVVAYGASDRASEAILSIALYPKWANLFFGEGAKLSDPKKILQGNGKTIRHVTIRTLADLEQPAVEEMIVRALKNASKPIDPSSKRRLVIKSISAKQRPRKP